MICTAHLDSCLPWELDEHIARTLRVRLLHPLVESELLLDDQVIPDNPKLFLSQIVSRTDDPEHLLRYEELWLYILTSHCRLTISTTATRNLKASVRVMV